MTHHNSTAPPQTPPTPPQPTLSLPILTSLHTNSNIQQRQQPLVLSGSPQGAGSHGDYPNCPVPTIHQGLPSNNASPQVHRGNSLSLRKEQIFPPIRSVTSAIPTVPFAQIAPRRPLLSKSPDPLLSATQPNTNALKPFPMPQKRKRVVKNGEDIGQGWSEEGLSILVEWFSNPENLERFNNPKKGDNKTRTYKDLCELIKSRTGICKDVLSVKNKIRDMKASYAKALRFYTETGQGDKEEQSFKDAVLKRCNFFYKVYEVWQSAAINPIDIQINESDRNHDVVELDDNSQSSDDSEEEVLERSKRRRNGTTTAPATAPSIATPLTTTERSLKHLEKILEKDFTPSLDSFSSSSIIQNFEKQYSLELAREETSRLKEREMTERQKEKEITERQKEKELTERQKIALEMKKIELEILKAQIMLKSNNRILNAK